MASFLDKIKIATGVQARNKFDLSHVHLTTQSFYSIKPVYSKEIMPNESINIDYAMFSRCAPLDEPVMAHVNTVTRAFFVPYRTVWKRFNSFITGTSYEGNTFPKSVPYLTNGGVYSLFQLPAFSETVTGDIVADFYDVDGNKKVFTPYGRRCYDILLGLGYSFNFTNDGRANLSMSALPLLSFLRVYFDWCQNTNYDNFSVITRLFDGVDNFNVDSDLSVIFGYITTAQYHTDLFTSAFDNPTGPNVNGNDITFELQGKNTTYPQSEKVERQRNNFDGTPNIITASGSFTQNGLFILHALTDYYQRLRATGSRVLDRYFGEFGVRLSEETLQRSSYLGGNENEIRVLDVMNNSNIETGSYAGQAIGDINGSVSYKSNEFGHILILSYIEPRTSTVQGIDRTLLHRNRFDFFQGDMDAIGYQAISQAELVHDYKGVDFAAYLNHHEYASDGIFGYSGRYYEYKVAHDKLTGMFRSSRLNTGMDAWHTFRMVDNDNDVKQVDTDVPVRFKHSLSFTMPSNPATYNRIFGNIFAVDNFICRWSFRVSASLPAKPLFEQYEYAEHGRQEVVNLGGTNVIN